MAARTNPNANQVNDTDIAISNKKPFLTTIDSFDINKLVFSKPIQKFVRTKLPNGQLDPKPGAQYYTINIGVKDDDGKMAKLILLTPPDLKSYGIQQDTMFKSGRYTFSLSLWDRDGATEEQKKFTDILNQINQKCKEEIIRVKKVLKQPELIIEMLAGMKLVKHPKDKDGLPDESKSPNLSVKIIEYPEQIKENGTVVPRRVESKFFKRGEVDARGKPVQYEDYKQLLDKRGIATAAIVIDNIFYGTQKGVQAKLWEVDFQEIEQISERLLPMYKPVQMSYTKPQDDIEEMIKNEAITIGSGESEELKNEGEIPEIDELGEEEKGYELPTAKSTSSPVSVSTEHARVTTGYGSPQVTKTTVEVAKEPVKTVRRRATPADK